MAVRTYLLVSAILWTLRAATVSFLSFLFHVDPRRTASTYWEPIINQAHLTFNIIRPSLFVKEVLSFLFSK